MNLFPKWWKTERPEWLEVEDHGRAPPQPEKVDTRQDGHVRIEVEARHWHLADATHRLTFVVETIANDRYHIRISDGVRDISVPVNVADELVDAVLCIKRAMGAGT